YVTFGAADMLSSDGRCRTFGKGGDGYVSAEGVGAVLLKPLRRALQDPDRVYAVVKASSVNHAGASGGMTVPTPAGQAAVIARWLEKSGALPRHISHRAERA